MNKELIKKELESSYGYDFESEFFTDEIKTLYDEVVSVAILIHNKKIKELEDEKLKAYNLGLSALNESIEDKKQLQSIIDKQEIVINDLKQAMIRGSELNYKLKFDEPTNK